MAVGSINVDFTSLSSHGDTLFASGTKILKLLFYSVDYSTGGSTKLGLIDNPYSLQCYLTQGGGAAGAVVGSTNTSDSFTSAMVPVYLSSDCGLRVFTSVGAGGLIVITYVEMTT